MFADNPDLKVFASLLPKARFAPVIPGWEDIAQTTSNAVQKIYLGQGDIKATLKEAAAKINATLEKNVSLASRRRSARGGRALSARTRLRRARTPHDPRRATPYLLILPSFLLAAFIILWPLGEIVTLAVARRQPLRHACRAFTGLANFQSLFADPDFFAALWRTLVWTVAVVLGTLIVSMPIALILNEDFYGRGLARILVMLPWAVSLTMTAIVWRWALNGESGMLNSGLRDLGLIDHNIQWLAQASTAFPMQILIGILVSIPFTVTIFLGGLSSVPEDLYDAAAIEGAGRWQQFRLITLPLLRPVHQHRLRAQHDLCVQFVSDHLGDDAGRPGQLDRHPRHLSLQARLPLGRLGEAAAVSLIMFAILLVFTLIYVRLAMREEAAHETRASCSVRCSSGRCCRRS